MSLESLRTSYVHPPLLEEHVSADPLVQFTAWLDEAIAANVPEPNAMTLATVSRDGSPHARVVLLRAATNEGLVFYTNYTSDKAEEIAHERKVSLSFFWPLLSRQVRVVGPAARVAAEISDAYFASRPRGHQIGAWVSEQSKVIASREVLVERTQQFEKTFANAPVPRPPHWGGYRVAPQLFEFWQGQENRLHDRLRYRFVDGAWARERLAP